MIKMVIVDDFIETAESISILYGCRQDVEIVGIAQTGEQLWQIFREREVNFVSLDIQLGRENGLEICRLLHKRYPNVFIVMCSMEATIENIRIAAEAGATHFLAKPITMKDTAETIQIFSDKRMNMDSSPLTNEKLDELLDLL